MHELLLPDIPGTPFRALDHTAHAGLWEGGLHEVRWGYPKGWLRSQVRRALLRRRWFDIVVHAEGLALAAVIRDEGTTGAARAVVWDTTSGEVLARIEGTGRPLGELNVGPFAAEGTNAALETAAVDLRLTRGVGRSAWTLVGRGDGLVIDATLDTHDAPAPVTAIGEPRKRRPGLTSRWNLLAARGTLEIAGQARPIEGLGTLAYANTFAVPGTRWLALTATGRLPDGRRIGLSLSDGSRHGEVHEHVLWLDDAPAGERPDPKGATLTLLPRARLLVGGVVARDTWRVRSPHGDLELKFRPRGSDVELVRRPIGSMHVERVMGTLSGRIPLPDGTQAIVDGLPAFAEDHRAG